MAENISQSPDWPLIKQLWLVSLVFVFLGVSVAIGLITKPNELAATLRPSAMENTQNGTKIGHNGNALNVTAVTDWVLHHKKTAAIGMIVGVVIAFLIVALICCIVSKFAVEKVKRQKKKKGGVLRGILKMIKLPKLRMPKFSLFKVQPKGGFGKEIKNIGSLYFSLYYEKATAHLFVTILKADDLSLKSAAYVSFNFVRVELDPFSIANSASEQHLETKHVRNSVFPVFNDVITINIHPEELKEQTLVLSVFDENRISPKDLIGVVALELDGVFRQIYEKEKDFHEKLKWRKAGKGGDILLNFKWNPKDEIFHVIVKECSNLTGMDSKGQSNPYVKIEMFDGTVRYFQDTTNTKSKTLFPVYNEMFQFQLSDKQKKSVCLIISVKHRPSWSGRKQVIGQLSFSFRSIGNELLHWQTSLSSGKDVEMMHSLHGAVQMPQKYSHLKSGGEGIFDELSEEENLLESEDDCLL